MKREPKGRLCLKDERVKEGSFYHNGEDIVAKEAVKISRDNRYNHILYVKVKKDGNKKETSERERRK